MRETMQEIKKEEIIDVKEKQRNYFASGKTKEIGFRLEQLERLKRAIKQSEHLIIEALQKDLGKHENESYTTEIGFVYHSISCAMRQLRQWMKPERVRTPFYMLPARSTIVSEPYGCVLIIAPYNYPVQLALEPLVGAIAAGNCTMLKLSELTPNVSEILAHVIETNFNPAFLWCINGGVETTTNLLEQAYDYIFFTGSPAVGKVVMQAAATHLTPVTLELGGKSPVIVDETANIKAAAERIVWGKTLNVGQTCVAPDYVYVHESVKEQFLMELQNYNQKFYGKDSLKSEQYGRIVNDRHMRRLQNILEKDEKQIVYGGNIDYNERRIEFTIIDVVTKQEACMQEEIFGPILPILSYVNLEDVIDHINRQPKPLALYIFSTDKQVQRKLLRETSSGGVCINDVISHIINPNLPFGGVGNSGIGTYHGKSSFDTFSHKKSVLQCHKNIKNKLAQPPYTKQQLHWMRKIFQ